MIGTTHDVGTFVGQLAQAQGWAWKSEGVEYLLEVPTGAGRTQVVHFQAGSDPDGTPMVFVWSAVGPASLVARDPTWFLAHNAELSHGACALFNGLLIVKQGVLLRPNEFEAVTRTTVHIARSADLLEAQLLGAHVDQS
jgi:hypothetical protein